MPRPRQSARRPATGSESVCSDVVPFMTKIYFSSWGRGRVPSDLIYLTSLILISWPKWIFRHEGLAAVLLDGIWSLGRSPLLLTKIDSVFARAARGGSVRDLFGWIGQPSSRLRFCPLVCIYHIQYYLAFGTIWCSVQPGLALVFCGNMCAVPSAWLSISPHIKFYMPVCFLCQICPSYGYDYSHIESDIARLSYRYDNHLMDL